MAPYAFVNVTMASTLVLSATLAYASAPAFSVVHDVVHEGPARKRRIKTGGLQKFVSLGHTRHLLLLRTGKLQRLSSRLSE